MNKNQDVFKKLAKSIIAEGSIDKDTQNFIEHDLSRSEIRTLLSYLKLEMDKQTVTITSAGPLPAEVKKQFEIDYQNNRIVYHENENLGAGLKIKIGDNIYDYSFRNYIDQTIEKLRG